MDFLKGNIFHNFKLYFLLIQVFSTFSTFTNVSTILATHIEVLLLLDLPNSYLIPYLIMGTASFMTTPTIKFFSYSFPKEMQDRKSGSKVAHE